MLASISSPVTDLDPRDLQNLHFTYPRPRSIDTALRDIYSPVTYFATACHRWLAGYIALCGVSSMLLAQFSHDIKSICVGGWLAAAVLCL